MHNDQSPGLVMASRKCLLWRQEIWVQAAKRAAAFEASYMAVTFAAESSTPGHVFTDLIASRHPRRASGHDAEPPLRRARSLPGWPWPTLNLAWLQEAWFLLAPQCVGASDSLMLGEARRAQQPCPSEFRPSSPHGGRRGTPWAPTSAHAWQGLICPIEIADTCVRISK